MNLILLDKYALCHLFYLLLDRVDEDWGANNEFELRWAGPWYRQDYDQRYPAFAKEDTQGALASG